MGSKIHLVLTPFHGSVIKVKSVVKSVSNTKATWQTAVLVHGMTYISQTGFIWHWPHFHGSLFSDFVCFNSMYYNLYKQYVYYIIKHKRFVWYTLSITFLENPYLHVIIISLNFFISKSTWLLLVLVHDVVKQQTFPWNLKKFQVVVSNHIHCIYIYCNFNYLFTNTV